MFLILQKNSSSLLGYIKTLRCIQDPSYNGPLPSSIRGGSQAFSLRDGGQPYGEELWAEEGEVILMVAGALISDFD